MMSGGRRLIPGATQQMLTNHLRDLECVGVVHRQVFAEVPPRVEYTLTELGRGLAPVLESLFEWGKVAQARHASFPAPAPRAPFSP